MKLYTEEEIRGFLNREFSYEIDAEIFISELKPIELPNDGDLYYQRNISNPYPTESQSHAAYEKGFEGCFIWLKGQIQGGKNEE